MGKRILALMIAAGLSQGCYTRTGKLDVPLTLVVAGATVGVIALAVIGSEAAAECEDPYGRCEGYDDPPPPSD